MFLLAWVIMGRSTDHLKTRIIQTVQNKNISQYQQILYTTHKESGITFKKTSQQPYWSQINVIIQLYKKNCNILTDHKRRMFYKKKTLWRKKSWYPQQRKSSIQFLQPAGSQGATNAWNFKQSHPSLPFATSFRYYWWTVDSREVLTVDMTARHGKYYKS